MFTRYRQGFLLKLAFRLCPQGVKGHYVPVLCADAPHGPLHVIVSPNSSERRHWGFQGHRGFLPATDSYLAHCCRGPPLHATSQSGLKAGKAQTLPSAVLLQIFYTKLKWGLTSAGTSSGNVCFLAAMSQSQELAARGTSQLQLSLSDPSNLARLGPGARTSASGHLRVQLQGSMEPQRVKVSP